MDNSRYLYLVKEITRHDELYEAGIPEIGDGEYDDLYFELLTIEREHPDWIVPESPSQKINTVLVSELEKKEHETPMLSQQKTKTKEGVADFVSDINGDITVGEKLDGLTIVLEYEDGKLSCATTRGNGYVGEIVTHNVLTIKNVPKMISYKGKLVLRGEALMPISEFERINVNGEYSNPRNLASGTLRQLDSSICAERGMIIKIFDLVTELDDFDNDTDALNWVASLGFDVVPNKLFKKENNMTDNIMDYIYSYENSIRKTLPYQIDGMVLKANDYGIRKALGYTSKWPRWGIAYKFKAQEASTTLRDVEHNVGKTGKITPVGIFDKIIIDDVEITRATLNNYNLIEKMGLMINSNILVIKSNDVIPKITSVVSSPTDGTAKKIQYPKTCPVCGSKTEFIGENLFCTGTNCPAQVKMSLINFCSRNALNINGLGEETISDLYDRGFITSIQDIYNISDKEEDICEIKGYGKKKIDKIKKSVEDTKNKTLDNLLTALSIKLIGKESAKLIANEFKSLDELVNAAKDKDSFVERCLTIEDFGENKTNSLYNYFSDTNNCNLIKFLQSKGVNPVVVTSSSTKNAFIDGKVFVITGELNVYKREELKKFIEANGGKCTGSVSKKTNYLINNDLTSTSSKNETAKSLGIPIISEATFIELKDKGEA